MLDEDGTPDARAGLRPMGQRNGGLAYGTKLSGLRLSDVTIVSPSYCKIGWTIRPGSCVALPIMHSCIVQVLYLGGLDSDERCTPLAISLL
jgi:hypothetical protein